MDPKEFKAWFEGFCEGVEGAPTAEQFAKIKAKVATLVPQVVALGPKPRLTDLEKAWGA